MGYKRAKETMKKLFVVLSILAMSMSVFARPSSLPSRSVNGANNTAYAEYSYACAGFGRSNITFSVSLENQSRGTTVVVVQITTDSECLTKRVEIGSGNSYAYVTFNVPEGACGDIQIIDAYVKR